MTEAERALIDYIIRSQWRDYSRGHWEAEVDGLIGAVLSERYDGETKRTFFDMFQRKHAADVGFHDWLQKSELPPELIRKWYKEAEEACRGTSR